MADKLSAERRSWNMARIPSKNTKPEMLVRSLAHSLGYRFRLHRKDLPGKPDLVFPSKRKVIFVHGCFWHQHSLAECLDGRVPKSRTEYWTAKLNRNVERDLAHLEALKALGWRALSIWECEIRDERSLARRVKAFLR